MVTEKRCVANHWLQQLHSYPTIWMSISIVSASLFLLPLFYISPGYNFEESVVFVTPLLSFANLVFCAASWYGFCNASIFSLPPSSPIYLVFLPESFCNPVSGSLPNIRKMVFPYWECVAKNCMLQLPLE